MLADPGQFWPSQWNPRRLVVQHMNAMDLHYEDASFDAVFSSSSIEHFGGIEDVRRAISEMHRVLTPSGILSLSTEYRISGDGELPGTLAFTTSQLQELFQGFQWLSPMNTCVSERTRQSEQRFIDAAADVKSHLAEYDMLLFHKLEWFRYPHIVLREGNLLWTSVHLALRKPK
jgi:SAM-dependent methyltransferase